MLLEQKELLSQFCEFGAFSHKMALWPSEKVFNKPVRNFSVEDSFGTL